MSPQESRYLWFFLDGGRTAYAMHIPIGFRVQELKATIQQRIKSLVDTDLDDLKLWKLNVVVPVDPDDSLAQRLADVGNMRKLSIGEKVGELFPEPHSEEHLHIVIRCPPDDRPSSKRPRLSGPILDDLEHHRESWLELHNELWGKGLKNFQDQYIEHRTEKNGGSFRIMKNHRAFKLSPLKGLLVRDEWDITWDRAENARGENISNFIIVGQTGIGKTLSLYYFLAWRLALGLTTFFQHAPTYVWLFDKRGVLPYSSTMQWDAIPDLSKDHTAWALVDSNKNIQDPAPLLYELGSPFFIVEACSPRKQRWAWEKYHGTTQFFYTKPFLLEEILRGNLVQAKESDEAALRNFFFQYGPSARECYRATSTINGLIQYRSRLDHAITLMTWDEIDRVIAQEAFELKINDETSLLIVLILPADDKRIRYRATIITRAILRLLWKAHGVHLNRKSRELFHLFSGQRETSVTAGWLFEGMVHDLLDKGMTVPIDPMALERNNRSNAVNDKYVAPDIGTRMWESSAMEYVPFTQNDRALVLEPRHYYVPVDPSHPTYDSFTFERVPCASYEGPILNPKDKEVYDKAVLDENSDIGLFTVFQVTMAAEHDLNEKGLNYICVIADQNGFKAIGIRYVGIIPAGQKRIFKTLIAWRGKLDTYALSMVNYDPKSPKQSVSPPLSTVGP